MLQLKFYGKEVLSILRLSLDGRFRHRPTALIVWFIEVLVFAAFSKLLEPRPLDFEKTSFS
jgi:hypothetical protein